MFSQPLKRDQLSILLSDESVVEQWSENNYYQYFCGEQEFQPRVPCEASELVHFRHRIGKEGVELILKESIRINGKDSNDKDVYIDTTVQEKNITFPTDDHRLSRNYYKGITGDEINVMLASAGFNFKRMTNRWKSFIWLFLEKIFLFLTRQLDPIRDGLILQTEEKWAF